MKSKTQATQEYTDEQINDLADWLEDLTLKQAFFLKETYEAHMRQQALAASKKESEFAH